MSSRVRQLLGLLTVCLFAVVGSSVWMEGNRPVGGTILSLAAFRLAWWVRIQWLLMHEDE
jgi:hypothetical protein